MNFLTYVFMGIIVLFIKWDDINKKDWKDYLLTILGWPYFFLKFICDFMEKLGKRMKEGE